MNLEDKHIIYFLGIGGIGMSALARWFKVNGKSVSGYDRTETSLTLKLQQEGMNINYVDAAENIPEDVRMSPGITLVIYTPAIPKENSQLKYFAGHGYDMMKRSEVLGMLTQDHFTVAVAGTHGKTTTSSIIAHIFHTAGRSMVAFMGGILQNYESNLIMVLNGEGPVTMVTEADEYDRSFLRLSPDIAVITAADADHLDIYGTLESMRESFGQFVERIRKGGKLFIRKGVAENIPFRNNEGIVVHEYNLDHSSIRAQNIRIEREEIRFNFISPQTEIENISLSQPGNHNVENAVAAIAVCLECGISEGHIKEAFSTYRGVKRRFEYVILSPGLIFIDDYAHHPEEISAFIGSVKSMYPERNLTVIFQPHLFTRTRDFAREFAASLSLADDIILLDIYPAREHPIPGVTSELIYNELNSTSRAMCKKEALLEMLKNKKIDVLATVGAGDIDKMVQPIKEMLTAEP